LTAGKPVEYPGILEVLDKVPAISFADARDIIWGNILAVFLLQSFCQFDFQHARSGPRSDREIVLNHSTKSYRTAPAVAWYVREPYG
jgi:hypothetical protein